MTKNVAASVRARLANRAKASGRPFQELLQFYGLERFLFRFCQSAHRDRFVLKGALMLRVWDAPTSRPTRDVDFLGFADNSLESLQQIVCAICCTTVEDDGLRFETDTVTATRIKEDADYEGVRVKFDGYLEKARLPMQVDIAFGDMLHPHATEAEIQHCSTCRHLSCAYTQWKPSSPRSSRLLRHLAAVPPIPVQWPDTRRSDREDLCESQDTPLC